MVKVLPNDLHVSQWKFCLGLSSAPYATADEYSSYTSETPLRETRGSLLVKEFFDKHHNSRVLLLLVVVLGISMVIGDAIPTPSISGIISIIPMISFSYRTMYRPPRISWLYLILLHLMDMQLYRIDRLTDFGGAVCPSTFWDTQGIIRALSPYYVDFFFKKAAKDGWSSLEGVVLCITGLLVLHLDAQFSVQA
ncbi:probable potassium transporter 13 [Mangifera indica]|uniref:probable potassium transporter 13 n=1 Tax=Mangifera indica TaxID=29780 RepID=UPI001CFAFD68|nr:probable potassium transporter 13 [Mangifera indica]